MIFYRTTRKEFSNDPTAAMSNITESFQTRIAASQADMISLKRTIDENRSANGQQQQHYKLISEALQKKLSGHVSDFQSSIKLHMSHVNQRQARVMKYGQTQTISVEGPLASVPTGGIKGRETEAVGSNGYAMFTKVGISKSQKQGISSENADPIHTSHLIIPGAHDAAVEAPSSSSQLRRRMANAAPVTSCAAGPASNSFGGAMQVSTQKAASRNDNMFRQSQKVERSIAQMGELFTQMASLVMAQGETVTRIEDDVESGLMETQEAHKNMESFYEITKGNRSIIFKIFLAMIIFAVLFLYWS
jgi:t-SNARE complex subunit (syntaxin)